MGDIIKKVSPALYQALGVFLPLITANCTILGFALITITKEHNLLESIVFEMENAAGFGLSLVIISGIREQLELMDIPKGMKDTPIALITAGILAMAFMGFSCKIRYYILHSSHNSGFFSAFMV